MRRREFIGAVGAAAAWPLCARAADHALRIGVLLLDNVEAASLQTGLRAGLGESGFVEGQNVRFEIRSADGKLDLLGDVAGSRDTPVAVMVGIADADDAAVLLDQVVDDVPLPRGNAMMEHAEEDLVELTPLHLVRVSPVEDRLRNDRAKPHGGSLGSFGDSFSRKQLQHISNVRGPRGISKHRRLQIFRRQPVTDREAE
jgi:hypothetical protein